MNLFGMLTSFLAFMDFGVMWYKAPKATAIVLVHIFGVFRHKEICLFSHTYLYLARRNKVADVDQISLNASGAVAGIFRGINFWNMTK